jgi:hypothetical protein
MTLTFSPLRSESAQEPFWSLSVEESCRVLESGSEGRAEEEASRRLLLEKLGEKKYKEITGG